MSLRPWDERILGENGKIKRKMRTLNCARRGRGMRHVSRLAVRVEARRGIDRSRRRTAIGLADTGSSHHSVPPIHKSWGRSFADHWSSIRRPIGKVPTKISNVSSQIIKHRPDTQRGRAPTFTINPDLAAACRLSSREPAP